MAKQSEKPTRLTRPEALQRMAAEWGMTYQPKDEWGLQRQLADFRLFRRGGSRRITNLLQSRDEMLETSFHLFDYRFTVSTGKSSKVFNQSVFFVESKRLGLPQFTMKPENFLHVIGDMLGFKDIDFEAYPKFSKNYYLKGEHEELIRSTLPHRFLRFFSQEREWHLEAVNYYLVFYRIDHLARPRELKTFFDKGKEIYKMLRDQAPPV